MIKAHYLTWELIRLLLVALLLLRKVREVRGQEGQSLLVGRAAKQRAHFSATENIRLHTAESKLFKFFKLHNLHFDAATS